MTQEEITGTVEKAVSNFLGKVMVQIERRIGEEVASRFDAIIPVFRPSLSTDETRPSATASREGRDSGGCGWFDAPGTRDRAPPPLM